MPAKSNFISKILLAGTVLLSTICASAQETVPRTEKFASGTIRVEIPTNAKRLKVISALPSQSSGLAITDRPEFETHWVTPKKKSITLDVSRFPVWIIENDLLASAKMHPDRSPFGCHPAAVNHVDFDAATDIGVVWDRSPEYIMWLHGQPDVKKDDYIWASYDQYFKNISPGMRPLKNITVVFDGLVDVPGRRRRAPVRRPSVDISRHLEGSTYRPKDQKAYSRWVAAVVERYDGDGYNDMPGLSVPCKFWQIDNEPPRLRKGYPDLVRITYNAIKTADPNAKVLIGGLVLPAGHFIRAYEREILPMLAELNGKSIDIIDFHWFGEVGEWRSFPAYMKRIKSDLKACGFSNTPIWITEMGTYSGQPASRRWRTFAFQSEQEQAAEMVKRYVIALSEGVEKVFWAWGMQEGFVNPKDNDFFDNTGFIYDGIGADDPGKGVQKVAYWTYQQMTRLLHHWNGEKPHRIYAGQGVTAFRFPLIGQLNQGIIVAWQGRADEGLPTSTQLTPRMRPQRNPSRKLR